MLALTAPNRQKSNGPRGSTGRLGSALAIAVLAGLVSPSAARAQTPRSAVWVFFDDKGTVEGAGLEAALRHREAELPARTLARRRRARGDRGVDRHDLPLDPGYLAHVRATGASVRVRSRWLNAVSVDATAAQVEALARLPEVARIEPVRRRWRAAPPPTDTRPAVAFGTDEFGLSSAQLALIGAIPLHRHCGLTGAGVVVGVQDTGFELDHQAFTGLNVLAAHDFINNDDIVANEPGDPNNQANHGTLVMGTLAGFDPGTFVGVAPGIDVILSKTERTDAEVPAEEDYYIAGLEWIEGQGADIFTASLGYSAWYTPADFDGQTTASAIVVNLAFDNGLAIFASMGNSGPAPSTIITPADAFGAMAVGATTLGGTVAGFSSRGPTVDGRIKPDIAAPGVDVASVDRGTMDQYVTWNGTSAAAPVAAGLAALILEARPDLTAQQLADLLRDTASQAATPDNDRGWGIIDGVLASGDACGCNDSDGDGFLGVLCGGDDCDDGEASVFPGAEELCDGLDNDCDGAVAADEVDEDGDGVLACAGDCDDDEPLVAPGLEEICGDGLDNDCEDGDEACPLTTGADTSGGEVTTGGVGSSGAEPPPLDDTGLPPGGTADEGSGSDTSGGAVPIDQGCGCAAPRTRGLPPSVLLLLLTVGAWRRRPRR